MIKIRNPAGSVTCIPAHAIVMLMQAGSSCALRLTDGSTVPLVQSLDDVLNHVAQTCPALGLNPSTIAQLPPLTQQR